MWRIFFNQSRAGWLDTSTIYIYLFIIRKEKKDLFSFDFLVDDLNTSVTIYGFMKKVVGPGLNISNI